MMENRSTKINGIDTCDPLLYRTVGNNNFVIQIIISFFPFKLVVVPVRLVDYFSFSSKSFEKDAKLMEQSILELSWVRKSKNYCKK